MRVAPLTPHDKPQWAELLAISFDRKPEDMLRLLDWLHQGHSIIGWGAWDGDKLAAQYNCAMMHIAQPDDTTVPAGMSINMAVDPAYRGRGLIKQVSQPVYEAVASCEGVSGIGFSNKQGVKVDLKSKSYGYQVVGQMQSLVVWLRPQRQTAIALTDVWPRSPFAQAATLNSSLFRFATTPETLAHRFADHPFRRYQFGVWEDGGVVQGVVVYRTMWLAGVKGVSLLAAYGAQISELLVRWSVAIQREGMRFVHVLSTPQGRVRSELHALGYVATMPYSRSPYYLTVKPFTNTPKAFLDFKAWDCLGGDIL